jgi:Domain of unknown function (DUF1707)
VSAACWTSRSCWDRRLPDDKPALRASDADRERTAERLRRAAGEGRLDMDELEERLHAVYAARTQVELETFVGDLPAPAAGAAQRMPVRRGEPGTSRLISILGGHERKGRWRIAPECRVVNILGGSELDLNDAELADEIVELRVFSLLGGGEIRVPDGLNVEVSDLGFLGGNDVSLGEERPDPGGPLLRLHLISILGGVEVRRGRKLTRAERRALKRSGGAP